LEDIGIHTHGTDSDDSSVTEGGWLRRVRMGVVWGVEGPDHEPDLLRVRVAWRTHFERVDFMAF